MSIYQNRGFVKRGQNDAKVKMIPLPKLRDDYILVKTMAVALNPADWQDLGEPYAPGSPPLLIGCDYAGIVEDVGKDVTKSIQKGDRVMGAAHGTNTVNPEDGAFAEHIVVKGDIAMKIPSHMSFADASTLPSGVSTVALGLYKHIGLPLPPATVTESSWLLIYGGSSATGTLAIQFAKLQVKGGSGLWYFSLTISSSGLKVVTTCSPRNFDLVNSLGADAVFDYSDPECANKIRQLTDDKMTQVFDTIATPDTAKNCGDSFGPKERGHYVNLMGVDCPRDNVESVFFLGYTMLGKPFQYDGVEWPAVPEDYALAKAFGTVVEKLLQQGKLKPHPASVRSGGLEGIQGGLGDMKAKKISGEKLVYIIGNED